MMKFILQFWDLSCEFSFFLFQLFSILQSLTMDLLHFLTFADLWLDFEVLVFIFVDLRHQLTILFYLFS